MARVPQSPTTDFTSTTLNGAINDSVTSVTVNDASTMVAPCYIVVDREDNNGVATPTLREVMYVTDISTNTLTVQRAQDNSTARSHNDSALVEPMITVGFWDDMYDAFDNEHTPYDGSHDITKVAMLSGTTVQTLAGKILSSPTIACGSMSSITTTTLTVSSNANASGASIVGFTSSRVITGTRDMTVASGDVSYTGVGFRPSCITCYAGVNGATVAQSWGLAGSNLNAACQEYDYNAVYYPNQTALIYMQTASSTKQSAVVKSYDADGFTLTWTKEGSPTGTANLIFLCQR